MSEAILDNVYKYTEQSNKDILLEKITIDTTNYNIIKWNNLLRI